METFLEFLRQHLSGIYLPRIHFSDVVEIVIIAILIYIFMLWIQRTRAYTLLRGILIVAVFMMFAAVFQLSEILWLTQRLASIALLALVIIFQPELRHALESLGQRSFKEILPFDVGREKKARFSDATINSVVRAVNEMSEVKTGALIVIEQNIRLSEFIHTGINLDSELSSQLLINIFEKNTPLHDGAVIIRGDRIVAATCYLPLSDNVTISKRYGTRHRAALGISEVSDSFTIIVSEETGRVSYAYMGDLVTGITASDLREKLHGVQKGTLEARQERLFRTRRGEDADEE